MGGENQTTEIGFLKLSLQENRGYKNIVFKGRHAFKIHKQWKSGFHQSIPRQFQIGAETTQESVSLILKYGNCSKGMT